MSEEVISVADYVEREYERQHVAVLHVETGDIDVDDLEDDVAAFLEVNEAAPSGYNMREYRGGWTGDKDGLDDYMRPGVAIHIWIDTKEELSNVEQLKEWLENSYNKKCVCLSLEQRRFKH